MVMYRVNTMFRYFVTIKAFEVIKETEKCVFIDSGRETKESSSGRWFHDIEEARAFAVKRSEGIITELEHSLERAKSKLKDAKNFSE